MIVVSLMRYDEICDEGAIVFFAGGGGSLFMMADCRFFLILACIENSGHSFAYGKDSGPPFGLQKIGPSL